MWVRNRGPIIRNIEDDSATDDEEDREEENLNRRRKIEKREKPDGGKKRKRQERFWREHMLTAGSEAITPSRYQVVSHERRASAMERVRGDVDMNDQSVGAELGLRG